MFQNNLCNINEFKQNKNALEEARHLLKNHQYEEAIELAYIAYKNQPNSEDTIFTYAQALYLCGYENKARLLFEKIENYKEPYYGGCGICFYLADCYCMENYNLFKALKLINKAIESDKNNRQRVNSELEVKGRILYVMGYYDKVLPIFERLYKKIPSKILEIYLAKIYYKRGNNLKGYLYFTKIFNYYEEQSANLTYEEIQCYLDIKLNEYSKECKKDIDEKLKQSIEEKLGIRKTTLKNMNDGKIHVHIAEILSKVLVWVCNLAACKVRKWYKRKKKCTTKLVLFKNRIQLFSKVVFSTS